MEKGKNGLVSKLKWFYTLTKNGLFIHGVRNNLAKIGLDFMPYYWEIGSTDIEPPKIRDEESQYKLSVFGKEEITFVKSNIIGIAHKDLMSDIEDGDICLGIKKNGSIAVYSYIKQCAFNFRGRKFEINSSEAYIHNTYTFENFRGKNLAPYLRYQSYKHLKEEGVKKFYSISEYFNKPTLRYKQKLNVRPLALYLSVILFKKWTLNFKLKSYL